MNLGITDKRALILGASQGLGAASAAALAAEGVAVTLLARSEEKLQARVAEIGAGAGYLVADLFNRADLDAVFADARGYDILVLNAPPPPPVSARQVDRAAWGRQFEAMFLNQIELAAHLGAGMAARRWGRIISIASTSVQEPIPGLVYSNALRAALNNWLKSLADELGPEGVTVNTVAPGAFATERTASLDAAAAGRSGRSLAEVKVEGVAGIPAGRYGEAAEFGAMVAFLAGDASAYTNGAFIRLDGGSSRGAT